MHKQIVDTGYRIGILSKTMKSIWDPARLIEARTKREISIITAAGELSITPEYLSMLENGHKKPSNKLIANMCELYGQKAAFFLSAEHQAAGT